jgi:rhamnosyltransferase
VSHRIAAVVVVYEPTPAPLLQLVRALSADVERVYLFLNSPVAPDLVADCNAAAQPTPLIALGDRNNVGLGCAYNAAAAAARADGCELLLLFDQDSAPRPGIAGRLAAMFDTARSSFPAVAAIGPQPVSPQAGPHYKFPLITRGACWRRRDLAEVAFVISSGSLISLDALQQVGPFRDDFFIDAIDIEWCFRARARGFRCAMALDECMPHRLGSGLVAVPLLGVRLIEQPPARLFTFARNQTAMMRLSHVPPWWKARIAALLLLRIVLSVARRRPGLEALALLRGARDGWRGRLGPPA